MKNLLFYLFSFGLMGVLFSATVPAQETRRTVSAASSLYVISAKAGGVNYVEGRVNVARKTGRSGLLLKGDTLEVGDKVSTGADGKAEILLNPGSFARLAENSDFEFSTTALEDLQLKLNSGSAMFEVITDNEFTFAVNTPKAKFYVVKTGVYRVDVRGDGTSVIEVWKGKAQVGDAYNTEVKGGRQAVVNGSAVSVAKFDRGEKDALETFSKSRAKELAKVNAKLQNRDVRTSLMNSFYRSGWSLNDSYGLWVYNSFYGTHCFLPFGYGWNSPYGYFYSSDIWYYNLPPVIYYPTITNQPPTTAAPIKVGSPGIKNQSNGRGEDEAATVKVRPPFQRVQREIGQFPTDREVNMPSLPQMGQPSASPSSSSPLPSAPPPVIITAPATGPTRKGGN